MEILNGDDFKPPELISLGYCSEVSCGQYFYHPESPLFERTIQEIGEQVYFVDHLAYSELLCIAKERLRRIWSHEVAKALLRDTCPGFDEMRTRLKSKDKSVKVSSYDDFDRYDLGKLFCLEDFATEDQAIIREGIPSSVFRFQRFLERVTDDRGFLRLLPNIRHFQLEPHHSRNWDSDPLVYHGEVKEEQVHLVPELDTPTGKRNQANPTSAVKFVSP